jgi:hypothetical protein
MQNTLDHRHTALTETPRLVGMCHEWVLQEDVDGVHGRYFIDDVARLGFHVESRSWRRFEKRVRCRTATEAFSRAMLDTARAGAIF